MILIPMCYKDIIQIRHPVIPESRKQNIFSHLFIIRRSAIDHNIGSLFRPDQYAIPLPDIQKGNRKRTIQSTSCIHTKRQHDKHPCYPIPDFPVFPFFYRLLITIFPCCLLSTNPAFCFSYCLLTLCAVRAGISICSHLDHKIQA